MPLNLRPAKEHQREEKLRLNEYMVVTALIGIAVAANFVHIGTDLSSFFENVSRAFRPFSSG